MQTDNLASTLRKSQGQQELGRGSSPLAQQMQTASNGSRENVDAFSGLRINTTANGGPRQDVMDLDGEADEDEDRSDSPDLGGQGMEDEMLDEDEGEFSCATVFFPLPSSVQSKGADYGRAPAETISPRAPLCRTRILTLSMFMPCTRLWPRSTVKLQSPRETLWTYSTTPTPTGGLSESSTPKALATSQPKTSRRHSRDWPGSTNTETLM